MEEDFEYQLKVQKEIEAAQAQSQTEEGEQTYTDPTDGTVYEWDSEKRAWFPKIDNTFLAMYHANYGYYPTENPDEAEKPQESTSEIEIKEKEKPDVPEPKKKKPSESGWFDVDDAHNTNVYVSGLPVDITMDEFYDHMLKCGLIMEDDDGHPKIKLYYDVNGQPKGDGLCCYYKVESVELAIDLLDESEIRGSKLSIQKAKFQMKGAYNPALKKKSNKKKNKKNFQEKLLDWRERKQEGPSRTKFDKIIIFKHLFDPKEFEDNSTLINDIRDDLREECEKLGEVKKVIIFDRHVDGVASVAFKEFEAAEKCIAAMNGRYYGGKQLEVCVWDGVTNYQIEETEKERELRLKKWEDYLASGGDKESLSSDVKEPTEDPPT